MKEIEIYLRKLLLEIFLLFFRKRKRIGEIDKTEINKVLLIRLNKIGDALVATPLIKVLADDLNAKFDILADKKNSFIFENNSSINEIITFRKGLVEIIRLVKNLNKCNYDLIIDLHDDVSTTVTILTALIKADYKIGLEKENSGIYTSTLPRPDPSKIHVIDRLLTFTKIFDINYDSSKVNIDYQITAANLNKVEQYISKINFSNKYLVGINISAGSDARFWGIERFKKLLNSLNEYNCQIIILTHKSDLDKAQSIANGEYPVYYSDSFEEFSGIISKLNFLITPDTSIVHIASAFKVPLFGIYVKYNTSDIIWFPYKSEYECIVTTEPTLINLDYEKVENIFKPFFEKKYYETRNTKV